jgi:putative sporulation protein YyaC
MYTSRLVYYINPSDKQPITSLSRLIRARIPKDTEPVILCIGSDRITGDCLGPITGTRLCTALGGSIKVFGTLENPVHALNLHEITEDIRQSMSKPYIIAVDACLGTHIGCVTLSEGSLKPGSGVNNPLGSVGQLAITGIVGSCHGNAMGNLSTVRLNSVVTLSEIISKALINCFL